MSIRFRDLTSQVDGIIMEFTISPAIYDLESTIPMFNGQALTRDVDYTENPDRKRIILNFAPAPDDKLTLYFEDPSISALPSAFNVSTLKSDYLWGLDLKDQFGNVMSDVTLGNKMSIGLARMERELRDFNLTPKVIKSTAVKGVKDLGGGYAIQPEPVLEAATDIFEDPYDYDVSDYMNWGYITLRRKPIVTIERIRLIYPTGQEIIRYPNEWIKPYRKFGQVQIVPMAGSFKQYPLIGQGAMYLPLLSGFLTKNVPQLIHVDYTAGLTEIPDDLKDAIYKLGSVEVLKQSGHGKAPGVASISTGVDGLSESTTLTQSGQTQMFGALIKQYEDDVKAFIKDYGQYQKGIDFRVA